MKPLINRGRRDFVKSATLITGAVIGSGVQSCTTRDKFDNYSGVKYFPLTKADIKSGSDVAGLLFSQVGYELGYPVRIIIRLPAKELLSDKATCHLIPESDEKSFNTAIHCWGELWKSHWWIAEFENIDEEGTWNIEVRQKHDCLIRSEGLRIAKNILWESTAELSAVDMLERRVHFTGVGAGWQDAGTKWVESPAQSAMVMSLADILKNSENGISETFRNRIFTQIKVGADYLVMTEKKATELGNPPGAMCHDIVGHEEFILPNDIVKAVVALYQAASVLPESEVISKKNYRETAGRSFNWLTQFCKPLGDTGFNRRQRGLTADISIPSDELPTRDLLFLCWGALEQFKLGIDGSKNNCIEIAQEIMDRQIQKSESENGFYGHFREYKSLSYSQKSWCHGMEGSVFGTDIGGFYPNYLMPFVEMLKMWGGHAEAVKWHNALKDFTYGYLIPGCKANPFNIVPLGIYGNEGPLWFTGPFHGTNTIYGFTAALALELEKIFNEPFLRVLAMGNIQWLAGLNAGVTKENLKACVVYSEDIPEGVALPASMIHKIGNKTAGTWFNTRGVICNGFSTGTQFVMDVDPVKENDGPFSFTDEDWIPHTAGWLTAIVRL